jgi:deoxycytidylate deaminase
MKPDQKIETEAEFRALWEVECREWQTISDELLALTRDSVVAADVTEEQRRRMHNRCEVSVTDSEFFRQNFGAPGPPLLRLVKPTVERIRPSFHAITMRIALDVARRSTCRRLSVGCVIYSADFQRMLAWGYNGNAEGLANDCDSDVPGSCGCVHAECNAVIKCREPAETPKIVLCTDLPCPACAKILINLGGVQAVYYARDYRIRTGAEFLNRVGIAVDKLDAPDGEPWPYMRETR